MHNPSGGLRTERAAKSKRRRAGSTALVLDGRVSRAGLALGERGPTEGYSPDSDRSALSPVPPGSPSAP